MLGLSPSSTLVGGDLVSDTRWCLYRLETQPKGAREQHQDNQPSHRAGEHCTAERRPRDGKLTEHLPSLGHPVPAGVGDER